MLATNDSDATTDHHTQALPAPPLGIDWDTSEAQRSAWGRDRDALGVSPLAIARPNTSDEVQRLVRWGVANRIPLIPVSSRQGSRRYGDTVPRAAGVMLDLARMQRLLHIDARDRIVIIEPGVTFGQINELLKPHGLRAFMPLRPRAGKSVIAAHLEREPITQPGEHWDVSDPLGGMEVVLGNGEFFRTGGAALPMTLQEQLARGNRQMVGVGPSVLDLQRVLQGAQGTLGVVTWAAMYVRRIPTQEVAWSITAADSAPLIDLAYALLHRQITADLFIVNRMQLALLLFDTVCPGQQGVAQLNELAKQLPEWCLFVTQHATSHQPTEKMAYQLHDLKQLCAAHRLVPGTALGPVSSAHLLQALRRPAAQPYEDHALGAHQSLFFLQQLHRAATFIDLAHSATGSVGDVGIYLQPMMQGTNCHMAFTLPHAPDTAATVAARSALQQTAERCATAGAFFSRPYEHWAALAFARDPGIRKYLDMTKNILDPQGVLNPGRLYHGS